MGLPTPIDPIPLPDLHRLDRMPSLPEWVGSRIESLKIETQPDPVTGRHHLVPTLPSNLMLDERQRDAIAQHITGLDACARSIPANDPAAEEAVLVIVTKLMLALPSPKQNEASAEARGEAFMAALDDLPPWAVAAAARRWYRGDVGKDARGEPHDTHWCPAPSELRGIAQVELWRVLGRAKILRDVLRAEPAVEYSDEHRRKMLERLSKLVHETLTNPPVGSNGSGGSVNVVDRGAYCGTTARRDPA
jgi:hypothetical protein